MHNISLFRRSFSSYFLCGVFYLAFSQSQYLNTAKQQNKARQRKPTDASFKSLCLHTKIKYRL